MYGAATFKMLAVIELDELDWVPKITLAVALVAWSAAFIGLCWQGFRRGEVATVPHRIWPSAAPLIVIAAVVRHCSRTALIGLLAERGASRPILQQNLATRHATTSPPGRHTHHGWAGAPGCGAGRRARCLRATVLWLPGCGVISRPC